MDTPREPARRDFAARHEALSLLLGPSVEGPATRLVSSGNGFVDTRTDSQLGERGSYWRVAGVHQAPYMRAGCLAKSGDGCPSTSTSPQMPNQEPSIAEPR
jgi:hypothetical protein